MDEMNGLTALRDALPTTLDALWAACRTGEANNLDEHCYHAIRRAVECARILPPAPTTFRRWFRAACRRADGSDYSRSQRALFAQRFNAVGLDWHRAGLTPELLQVRNYRRRLPQSVADPRVAQVLTPGQFRRLRQAFLGRLARGNVAHEPWEAFCGLAFALIVFGGVAWPGALSIITGLLWNDLRVAARGYITIHRRGCPFRFYLPPLACALALAMGTHLRRPHVFGEPATETPILPPVEDASCGPDAGVETEECARQTRRRQLRIACERFNRWLHDLCQEAGVPAVTVRTLASASRLALVSIYGQVIVGALLGQTAYAPLADDQRDDLFEGYMRPFHLAEAADIPQSTTPARPPKRSTPIEPVEGAALLARQLIADLHAACRPLVADGSVPYTAVAEALEALAGRLLGEIGISVADDLLLAFRAAYARLAGESQPATGDAERFNVACLSAWLAHLCRTARKRPATLRAYCSAGSGLVRQFPGVCWFELDEEDAQEVASLELATSTRGRLLVVLNSLLSFLEEQLGIHVVGMDRSRLRIRRRLEPVRLLRQDELERLLAYLLELAIRAHDAGNAAAMRLAYNAFHGALLATFFGLRAGELPRLLIGDVVLDAAQPYLRVWRSKRGKSRVVLAWKVPEEVLTILRREWTRRLASTGEDPAAPFLADERGDPVGARALADTVIQAMEALGLRDSGAEGRPVVFHTLRHVFANRLLVLGVSLRDVARAMGHIDTDTTTGSYLHCFDYLQRRRLAEQPVEFRHPGLSAGGIGALLGIGRPAAIAALKKADLHQMTTTTDENRRRLFWWESVVRLVADRLDMNEERRPKGDLSNRGDGVESSA